MLGGLAADDTDAQRRVQALRFRAAPSFYFHQGARLALFPLWEQQRGPGAGLPSLLCIFEAWRCDGQEDCLDGSDERDCLAAVPRKVITAALIGSLVCSLLLVIALGCALKLHSLRNREYRAFETQMTRMEAEFVQREAPPSYGQLIAQGLIPPVEDFPAYNPTQASMLQNLRLAMRRQIRRHSTRRSSSSSSRRRLGQLWSRLFRPAGRARGHAALLDPAQPSQVTLGLHSYHTVREEGSPGAAGVGAAVQDAAEDGGSSTSPAVDLQASAPESPASPLSPHSVNSSDSEAPSPIGGVPPSDLAAAPPCHRRPSKKLVLELAINLKGVSLKRYSPVGPFSPVSPPAPESSFLTQPERRHPQGSVVTSPSESGPPLVEGEEFDDHFSVDVPSEERSEEDGEGAS